MLIAHHDLGRDVMVVAYMAHHHRGEPALAEQMIGIAARAGVDAVRFDVYDVDRLVSRRDATQHELLSRYSLDLEAIEHLTQVAQQCGVLMLPTPHDVDIARRLDPTVPAFRITCADNDFYALLNAVAQLDKPILLSTGLSSMRRIRRSTQFIETIRQRLGRQSQLALLHSVVEPAEAGSVHLASLAELRKLGDVTIGYCDRTAGTEAAVLATALGARIIEKQFTLQRDNSQASAGAALPGEMMALVDHVHMTIEMLGETDPQPSSNQSHLRRSIVASRDLPAGTLLTLEDLDWVRPGDGLPCGREVDLVGRKINRAITKGELLKLNDVAPRRTRRSTTNGTKKLARV